MRRTLGLLGAALVLAATVVGVTAAVEDDVAGAATDLYDFTCSTPLGVVEAQVPLEFRARERGVPVGATIHFDVETGVPRLAHGRPDLRMVSMEHEFSRPGSGDVGVTFVGTGSPAAAWGTTLNSEVLALRWAAVGEGLIGLPADGGAVFPVGSTAPVQVHRRVVTYDTRPEELGLEIVVAPPEILLELREGAFGTDFFVTCTPAPTGPGEPVPVLSAVQLCRPQVFTDVPPANPFFCDIDWMSERGISLGYLPGPTYRPAAAVTRQAMSAFLYRLVGSPPFDAPSQATFGDVAPTHPFFDEIEWMAEVGLSTGVPATPKPLFKPDLTVSRQAMAAFLYRTGVQEDPDLTTPIFADVGPTHPFYREIQWMAEQGISTGTPASPKPRYKPSDPVSRQAMSAFLHRLDDLYADG